MPERQAVRDDELLQAHRRVGQLLHIRHNVFVSQPDATFRLTPDFAKAIDALAEKMVAAGIESIHWKDAVEQMRRAVAAVIPYEQHTMTGILLYLYEKLGFSGSVRELFETAIGHMHKEFSEATETWLAQQLIPAIDQEGKLAQGLSRHIYEQWEWSVNPDAARTQLQEEAEERQDDIGKGLKSLIQSLPSVDSVKDLWDTAEKKVKENKRLQGWLRDKLQFLPAARDARVARVMRKAGPPFRPDSGTPPGPAANEDAPAPEG